MKNISLVFILVVITSTSFSYDLGGECFERGKAVRARHVESGDFEKDLEQKKLYIRGKCDNKRRWYNLIEFLLKNQKNTEATDALADFFNRGLEVDSSDFKYSKEKLILEFLSSDTFRESSAGEFYYERQELSSIRKREALKKLKSMDSSIKPPKYYVSKDACPGEYCVFGAWDVCEDTVLYDKPFGNQIEAKATKGAKVEAITGEVYLEPTPLVVVYEITLGEFYWPDTPSDAPESIPFKIGDIIFLLDYEGEFFWRYIYNGKVSSDRIEAHESCTTPDKDCWVEYVAPDKNNTKHNWWFEIRLNDGTVGWSKEGRNFNFVPEREKCN